MGLGFIMTVLIIRVDGDDNKDLPTNAETKIRFRFERDSISQKGLENGKVG